MSGPTAATAGTAGAPAGLLRPTLTQVVREDRDVELEPMQFVRLMRRVFSYAWPHRRVIYTLIGLTIVRSVQLPMLVHMLSATINGPIAHFDLHGTLWDAAAFAALAALVQFTFGFRIRFGLELGELVVRDMRNAMFRHLQKMTASYFNTMKVGRLISRMSSDLEAIRLGVQDIVFMSVVGAGQALVAAILMFRADRVLFAVLMFMGPMIWMLNRRFGGIMQRAQRESQESFSRVTATLAESVSGIRVTQGFVREETNASLFRDLIEDHSRYNVNAGRAPPQSFLPLLELNSQIFIGLLLLVGGWRVLHGQETLASIVEFFFQSALFFDPIRGISTQYTQGLTALVGAERVFRLLDTAPAWTDPPEAKPLLQLRWRSGISRRQLRLRSRPSGAAGDQFSGDSRPDHRPRRPHRQREDLHHQSHNQSLAADWRKHPAGWHGHFAHNLSLAAQTPRRGAAKQLPLRRHRAR